MLYAHNSIQAMCYVLMCNYGMLFVLVSKKWRSSGICIFASQSHLVIHHLAADAMNPNNSTNIEHIDVFQPA